MYDLHRSKPSHHQYCSSGETHPTEATSLVDVIAIFGTESRVQRDENGRRTQDADSTVPPPGLQNAPGFLLGHPLHVDASAMRTKFGLRSGHRWRCKVEESPRREIK
ncbi:hypothetical protein EDD85DRAFT_798483 [Armillaria nabsnona]|nr:hypothetical protein EDD85DRAFT_798483 [Armillaria nabsnona]